MIRYNFWIISAALAAVMCIASAGCWAPAPPSQMVDFYDAGAPKDEARKLQSASMQAKAASKGRFRSTTLRVGRVAFTNASELINKSRDFCEYLESELGVASVKFVVANDYHGMLNNFANYEVDIAWISSASYVEGRKKNIGMEPLVRPVRFGSTSYRGIVIARADSGIRNLSDLRGKRFGWVDRESASGYISPRAMMMDAGIDPEKDLKEAIFLNKHDSVVINVLLKKIDAGACYFDARELLRDREKIDRISIVAITPELPNEPIVCRSDIPDELKRSIANAFLKLDSNLKEHREVLKVDSIDIQKFVPAADSDFDGIRKMMRSFDKIINLY